MYQWTMLNTMAATSGALTVYLPGVTRSLVVCVCVVDNCLSFCPFFFWPLCCLSFFDLRILITPLVFQTLLKQVVDLHLYYASLWTRNSILRSNGYTLK